MNKDVDFKVMSFGGGVQTVALAAMCCNGDFEMPDYAVFADPGWEGEDTYKYIDFFEPWMKSRGLNLIRTSAGNLRTDFLDKDKRCASMPLHTMLDGEKGMLMRQCTYDYKISPVMKITRRECGILPGKRMNKNIEMWLGISLDEALRMKPSMTQWIKNRYPLVEKKITRGDCLRYIKNSGLPTPPKSACVGCPFHSNRYWANLKNKHRSEWEDACSFDEKIRNLRRKLNAEVFIHSSATPLRTAYLEEDQIDMFNNECEGHCGL